MGIVIDVFFIYNVIQLVAQIQKKHRLIFYLSYTKTSKQFFYNDIVRLQISKETNVFSLYMNKIYYTCKIISKLERAKHSI